MVQRCCLLLLALSTAAGAWEFKEVLASETVSGPRRYDVYGAVAVGRRNLAVLYVLTADDKEYERLRAENGSGAYFVLAWLSPTWQLRELGERFFADPGDMSPEASDLSRIERFFAPALFPKVLVRRAEVGEEEEEGETCPYLIAFPTKFCCFADDLKVTSTHELPFVMNNVRVVEGEVWVVGVWEEHLIHRYDLKQRKLVEHRLPLNQLRQAIAQSGVTEEEMAQVTSPGKEPRQVRIPPLEKEATTPAEEAQQKTLREFVLPLLSLPTSFQYNVAVGGKHAAVLVRKPLGLWVTRWPQGGKGSFIRVKREDLPGTLPGGPTRLYVLGVEAVGKEEFFAAFEVHVAKTFAQMLVENPAEALEHQKREGREIAPGELAGLEVALMGVKFSRDKVEESWFQPTGTMEKWSTYRRPTFPYRPGEAWIGILGKKGWVQGIGRLQ